MREFFHEIRPHLGRATLEAVVMASFIAALALWLPEVIR